jgi:hypothetical protein
MNRGKVNYISLSIGVAMLIAALSFIGKAQIVTAQEFSGRATGINSTITTNGAASTTTAGDTCPLPPRGGSSTVTTSGILIPGSLASGTIVSTTSGSGITSQSSSNVGDFFFSGGGWTIHATNVSSSTQCNCCDIANPGCSGSSGVTGLSVTRPSGTFPITVAGAANQVVTLPNGAGTITFNERTSATGSLTVNAMHINITNGSTNYNVVVASSHSNILCPGIIITPEQVNVSGHTVDQNGAPIARVTVTITNSAGSVISTTASGADGSYTLTNITAGQTYIVQATNKSYSFAPRTLNLLDEVTGFDLVGTPHF